MKRFLFSMRLAMEGIRKNRRLYIPYLLSCIGMVMMSYIMQALSVSPVVKQMKGGGNVTLFLSIGKLVIAFFALLFLFYTNGFLTRRRYCEFGLYSILGLDRRGISRIVFCESLITAGISLSAGLTLGTGLFKLAELGLINAVHGEINYALTVSCSSVIYTLVIFGVIFLLLMLRSLWQIRKSRPLQLLHSENVGEKAPRANWVFAVIGLLLLGWAYITSVSIQTPMSALILFFFAVLAVILATYLLFMSGSVALCKLLQKNKRYYYRREHFVSVSSMTYRMKRNGAGLASICILATMVLVMIASTSSLYFGAEDAIATRFPLQTQLVINRNNMDDVSDEKLAELRAGYEAIFKAHDFVPRSVQDYRYTAMTGLQQNAVIDPDANSADASLFSYDKLRQLFFVSEEDVNRTMGTTYHLEAGEALIYPVRCAYDYDTLSITGVSLSFQVVGRADIVMEIPESCTTVIPAIIVIVPDLETIRPLDALNDYYPWHWFYGYNWMEGASEETVISMVSEHRDTALRVYQGGINYDFSCLASERNDFYSTFGGLFFLGIILSAVFIFAAVVIIYYKQISEGYEDQKRFVIMRKVGMTDRDIKKSINSQILTVFFAPLLFAGLHLAFAFPFIWKLLQLFNLRNVTLVIGITFGAFVLFGCLYGVIYRLTAGAYYRIVAAADKH